MDKCNLCPHKCDVDRSIKEGRCKSNDKVKIALSSIHYYEEPCLSSINGSGTIFFSNCNLNCVFCQNSKISSSGYGKEITVEHLADMMVNLQNKGVNNINLVTPTIYVRQIIKSIEMAKNKGLNIPIVYNSSGYENVETIKLLNGYIDIYLPDFKYGYNEIGEKYSKVNSYTDVCIDAIKEMYSQVKEAKFDKKGIMKKGIIIRHMILPNNLDNSKKVLDLIKENFTNNIYISIMAQYFPTFKAYQYEEINRKISADELEEIYNYVENLGFEKGFIQELGDHEEEYVPQFDLSEV